MSAKNIPLNKVVMRWNKKEGDWNFSWPDRAGKSLSGPFFDMTKTTGHRIDWEKDLISMLSERGYDHTTFQISVKKKRPAPEITGEKGADRG